MPKLYQPKECRPNQYFIGFDQSGDRIRLRAVDADGKPYDGGAILDIRSTGTLFLHRRIDPDVARGLGLDLDQTCAIKLVK